MIQIVTDHFPSGTWQTVQMACDGCGAVSPSSVVRADANDFTKAQSEYQMRRDGFFPVMRGSLRQSLCPKCQLNGGGK